MLTTIDHKLYGGTSYVKYHPSNDYKIEYCTLNYEKIFYNHWRNQDESVGWLQTPAVLDNRIPHSI